MIHPSFKVGYMRKGKERIVHTVDTLREAKKKDKELEMVASLIDETERLVKSGEVKLPKGMRFQSIERVFEEVFIAMASNQDGMKRAMKGDQYTEVTPKKSTRAPSKRP